MAIENVVIGYTADTSDIIRQLKNIQRLNSVLAKQIGTDFSKGFSVVSSELKKVQLDKKFKIKIDGKFKKVTGDIRTFTTTIKKSDGQLVKLTETLGISSKGTAKLATSLTQVTKAQSKLVGASSALKTNFNKLSSINANFSQQLKSTGNASKFLGTSLNQVSNDGTKVSKIFETTNGKFVQLTETTKKLPNGINNVSRSVKQLSKDQVQNIKTVEGMNKSTRSLGANLKTLLTRAALTIPVWFALRQGVGAVFRTIKDGLSAIVDFDRALQKAKRNLQGTAVDMKRNFGILRTEVTKLSIETGKSVEDITNAFQRFATVGFDFETSLAGANAATKTSILLFGDSEETANAFARTMRVLIDNSKDAKPASEQLQEVMALTVELWKENAFTLSEFTAGLERFAPVAKTAGFSASESAKLIATLGTAALRGSKAGRLLATSITRLVTKTDELAASLGVKVNPKLDRTFDIFLKTLDVLSKTRSEAGKISPEFEKITKSIFGLRSGLAVKGLIALNTELKKNIAVTGDIERFNKEFEEVNKTIFQLTAQFRNLNREIGKAFVVGLVGGEDFIDSLKEILELQTAIVKNARIFGKALVASTQITFGVDTKIVDEIEKQILKISDTSIKIFDEIDKKSQESFEKLVKGINGQLDRLELEQVIAEVDAKIKIGDDPQGIDIPTSVLKRAREALKKRFEELPPIEVEVETKVALGKIEITTGQQNKLIQDLIDDQIQRLKIDGAIESQQLKIKDALLRQFDVGDNLIAQKQRQLDIERAITEEQKARVTFSSESVKLAEIAKTEGLQTAIAISQVLSGQRDFNTFLRRGGIEAEILKTTFEDFVKNKQLEQFFKGERGFGIADVRGGQRISIRELGGAARGVTEREIIRQLEKAKFALGLRETTERNNSALLQNTASLDTLITLYKSGVQLIGTEAQRFVAQKVSQRQVLDINVNVEGIERTFSGTPEAIRELANRVSIGVAKAVEDKLVNDLITNNNAPISKATDTRIENF